MQLTIDPSIFHKIPNFMLGMNYYSKTTVSASPKMLKGRLQLFQEQLYFDLLDKEPSDFPGVAEWQSIRKIFTPPDEALPLALETIMQQIQDREYIPSFHSAEDLNTFFSLQYEIPAVIYDADEITGDVELSIGTQADGYEGLNGRFNTFGNQLLFSDDYSPFGSPYVDSIRTAVTEESENVLQLLFIRPSLPATDARQLTEACGKMFTSINGGDVISAVLDKFAPSCLING